MLSPKQNFLETIKPNGKPDRFVNQYEATIALPGDPLSAIVRGERTMGMEPIKDIWGTTIIWPEGHVAAMPHVTEETKVISDITRWREDVKIPDITSMCSDPAMWAPYLERVAQRVDRDNYLVMGSIATGVFERLHHLMGFEDVFVNLLTEPDDMKDLCHEITEFHYACLKLMCDFMKPDVIISQDDWGSKNSVFLSPDLWREFIKPCYEKCYGFLKERGVIVIHHSDSFLEPLMEDMVELGIDVWQGVLPENDIPKLQKELNGRMSLMGGIDSAIIDRSDSTEEETRADARRVCETYAENGHFIPCITYGGPRTLFPYGYDRVSDEISRYNKERFGI